uniref:ribosomal biogenesis factor-like n=1 Tax=Myxine glutinosa TaxID=7769 RepID=UPI00358F3A20
MGKHKVKATGSKDVFSIAWSKVRKVKKAQPVSTKLKKLTLPPRDLLSCSNAEFDKVRDTLLCVKGKVDMPEATMETEKEVPPRDDPPDVDETTGLLAQLTAVPSVSTIGR